MFSFIRKGRRLTGGLVALAVLVLSPSASAQQCENPDVLRFALVPAQDSGRELTYYEPILDLLSKNTGKKIELILPRSYSSAIEGLVGKWIDIAVLGPESYVIAHDKDRTIEVFGTYSRRAYGLQQPGPGYQSVLITRKGSAFTTIESLKGSVLALVDPASTSGALIPETVFPQDQHLPPLKQYFSRVIFSGKHDLSTLAVAEGKVDAAFVATYRFMEVVATGRVRQDDFNVLWTSPRLPQDPFVYRATLCQPIRQTVATTFLTADQTEEGRTYLDNIRSDRFVPMTDADYDIIRARRTGADR
jgi:phosphonate transport system substrate-binding protein